MGGTLRVAALPMRGCAESTPGEVFGSPRVDDEVGHAGGESVGFGQVRQWPRLDQVSMCA